MATGRIVAGSEALASLELPMSRCVALRKELFSPGLSFLMEAHNGLSAKIVELTGFRGIWASGLTMSASLGLRDANEASWTQIVELVEHMNDATNLPLLLDGDTGYGNFNNVRRLVRKLCERKVAGVCIEDKLFPKTNSFIGESQPLAAIDEFCGRIKAGKDSQTDDDFVLVARVEALISGHDMDEALRRGEAYHEAGADAVLIHSKQSSATEVLTFAKRWENRCPLIIVPTMYKDTPTDMFRQAGISVIIWANHNLRAAISAMHETSRRIFEDQSLREVEGRIVPIREVFQLMDNAELEMAERRYVPGRATIRAIVLATSAVKLGELAHPQPKCMIDIRGQPLLQRLVATFLNSGIRNVTVVRGALKGEVVMTGLKTVDNDRYAETNDVYSLSRVGNLFEGETIVVYGSVLFRQYILYGLLASSEDIVLTVDALTDTRSELGFFGDLVAADHPYSSDYLDNTPAYLQSLSTTVPSELVTGKWIGLARFSALGASWARQEIALLEADGMLESADLPLLFTRLAAKHPVAIHYITAHWLKVDTFTDLADEHDFT